MKLFVVILVKQMRKSLMNEVEIGVMDPREIDFEFQWNLIW